MAAPCQVQPLGIGGLRWALLGWTRCTKTEAGLGWCACKGTYGMICMVWHAWYGMMTMCFHNSGWLADIWPCLMSKLNHQSSQSIMLCLMYWFWSIRTLVWNMEMVLMMFYITSCNINKTNDEGKNRPPRHLYRHCHHYRLDHCHRQRFDHLPRQMKK